MPESLFASQDQAAAFAAALPTRYLGKPTRYYARTQSTNDLALAAARDGAGHGAVFVADAQDGGRGRRGRQWESPPNLSLLFSVLLRPETLPVAEFGWVPLTVGLAINDALQRAANLRGTIKWPNDLVIPAAEKPGWRKLGGILCESVLPSGDTAGFVVAGVGINVNQSATDLPTGTKAPPTSILIETKQHCDRVALLRELLVSLEQYANQLSEPSGCIAVKVEIQKNLREWWPEQRRLRVQSCEGGSEITGSFAGLDSFGRLMLRATDGREHFLADAEIIAVQ